MLRVAYRKFDRSAETEKLLRKYLPWANGAQSLRLSIADSSRIFFSSDIDQASPPERQSTPRCLRFIRFVGPW